MHIYVYMYRYVYIYIYILLPLALGHAARNEAAGYQIVTPAHSAWARGRVVAPPL